MDGRRSHREDEMMDAGKSRGNLQSCPLKSRLAHGLDIAPLTNCRWSTARPFSGVVGGVRVGRFRSFFLLPDLTNTLKPDLFGNRLILFFLSFSFQFFLSLRHTRLFHRKQRHRRAWQGKVLTWGVVKVHLTAVSGEVSDKSSTNIDFVSRFRESFGLAES